MFKFLKFLLHTPTVFADMNTGGTATDTLNSPSHLKCEDQINPLGIDIEAPAFSWHVQDLKYNAVQTAYQILVADSKALIDSDQGNIWDSGKIESDQSIWNVYQGSPLISCKKYYWKVRTWDKESNVSPFSNIATFETAFLAQNEWKARWIGKSGLNRTQPFPWGEWIWAPVQLEDRQNVYFRREFQIDDLQSVESTMLRGVSICGFDVWLNGTQIIHGSTFHRAYEQEIDEYLKPGKNIFAVQSFNKAKKQPGLKFTIRLDYSDGSENTILTDDNYKFNDQYVENWNHLDFNDSEWIQAKPLLGKEKPYQKEFDDPIVPLRSQMVRKEFALEKSVKSARVYVSGLGLYHFHLNGQKVGEDELTPGWTDYPHRLQYQIYDVTHLLQKGNNAIGALLGNGWWSGGVGAFDRRVFVYNDDMLCFIMQLEIEYDDGSFDTLLSDNSWRITPSPILSDCIYNGEIYDARLEITDWDKPGLDDADWKQVEYVNMRCENFVAQQHAPIKIVEVIKPVEVFETPKITTIVNFGENLVGWICLKVTGNEGDKIVIRHGEFLNEDQTLHTENLRGARAQEVYYCKGDKIEIIEPHFTYHGFQYIEISGLNQNLEVDQISAKRIRNNFEQTGHFKCSNSLINQIHDNVNHTIQGVMISVPNDNSVRDERFGWMGDGELTAPTVSYQYGMNRFYKKWIRDMADGQDEEGAVAEVAPRAVFDQVGHPAWGDAVIIVPWVAYQFTGDKRILVEQYEAMTKWIKYIQNHSVNGLYEKEGLGDWSALHRMPSESIGTVYFYYDAVLMEKISKILDKKDEVKKYNDLAQKVKNAFNEKYFIHESGLYEGETQTTQVLPIAFSLVDNKNHPNVLNELITRIRDKDHHLSTGFVGTRFVMQVLSDNGYHDLAYRLATETTFPSWGYMVKQGATTIWELWDADQNDPGMNVRNQLPFGSVGQWFYSHLAGIRGDDENAGFKHTMIKPMLHRELNWVKSSLQSPHGLIKCEWEYYEKFNLKIQIPPNTSATVVLPKLYNSHTKIFEKDQELYPNTNVAEIKEDNEKEIQFLIGSGQYNFIITE